MCIIMILFLRFYRVLSSYFPPPKNFVKSVIEATSIEGEILIMGMLSVTIFAFLIARSASPAHNKIFGAKFLSFERAAIVY